MSISQREIKRGLLEMGFEIGIVNSGKWKDVVVLGDYKLRQSNNVLVNLWSFYYFYKKGDIQGMWDYFYDLAVDRVTILKRENTIKDYEITFNEIFKTFQNMETRQIPFVIREDHFRLLGDIEATSNDLTYNLWVGEEDNG